MACSVSCGYLFCLSCVTSVLGTFYKIGIFLTSYTKFDGWLWLVGDLQVLEPVTGSCEHL